MSQTIILLVEPDAVLRADITDAFTLDGYSFVELDNEELALDWIWERGKEVAAVFVQQTSATLLDPNSLVNVLGRDWPDIRVLIGGATDDAVATIPNGFDYLPYPWTAWQVAQRLMKVSAQRAA